MSDKYYKRSGFSALTPDVLKKAMFKNLSIKFRESLLYPAYVIVALWFVHAIQVVLHLDLATFGVLPLREVGLRGIVFSPLIHSNWGHLMSNTFPLFFLGALTLFFYRRIAFASLLIIYFLSGLLTWVMPFQTGWHIGASGVVYGLWAFIICNGIFRRNLRSIALALIVVFYFGGMLAGILPGGQESVSWQGHLAGLLAGIFTSFWQKESIEKDEEKPRYSWEDEPQEETFFLDRDAFEKSKIERERDRNNDFSNWFSNRS